MSIRKLKTQPDLFLVDGQGYAHPYHCGFASHLGLVIRKPTIGAAKCRLFGETVKTPIEENITFLKHKSEIVGAAVSTGHGGKPVYVSTGHMVSLDTAIGIIKHCTQKNRIPEPLLRAHEIATEEKRKRQYSISE
jgi:deoxyribonuclease V